MRFAIKLLPCGGNIFSEKKIIMVKIFVNRGCFSIQIPKWNIIFVKEADTVYRCLWYRIFFFSCLLKMSICEVIAEVLASEKHSLKNIAMSITQTFLFFEILDEREHSRVVIGPFFIYFGV